MDVRVWAVAAVESAQELPLAVPARVVARPAALLAQHAVSLVVGLALPVVFQLAVLRHVRLAVAVVPLLPDVQLGQPLADVPLVAVRLAVSAVPARRVAPRVECQHAAVAAEVAELAAEAGAEFVAELAVELASVAAAQCLCPGVRPAL